MADALLFPEKDPIAPIRYVYAVRSILHEERSDFQEIAVLDSEYFGRILVLDGVIQLTERDEFFYHEMLTQVPLHAHPDPRNVLIIGGGDGGSLREVAKHDAVASIDLVEIDERVIEVSKQYFPTVATSYGDSRLTVAATDGAEFLKQTRKAYDVIIIDSTDPVGPARALSTSGFFTDAFNRLSADGMLAAQTESLHFHRDFVADVQNRLSQVFPIVDLYTVPLATYAGNWWTFSIASKRHDPRKQAQACSVPTRHYADDVHAHSFLPASVYQRLVRR